MQNEKNIYVDLETTGLDPQRHPIIQIAAIAVDGHMRELEIIELKVKFDEREATPEALQKNGYNQGLWEREGLEPTDAAKQFAAFLRRHATVDMSSKEGRPYLVAQLVGHNGATFDGPFLHAWYRRLGIFCPARYQTLCTLQRALWYFDEHKHETPPTNFKLGTLCEYFDVSLREEDAHDALADIRATVSLYRAMVKHPPPDRESRRDTTSASSQAHRLCRSETNHSWK